jgi:hypothetical protein
MLRRSLSVTLLLILALQFVGPVAFASVCVEPCSDDTEETSCPPVCTLCTSCTHAQKAVVQHGVSVVRRVGAQESFASTVSSASSLFAVDIFHVPLRG